MSTFLYLKTAPASRGFIALISVLLTSVLLLGLVALCSLEAMYVRDAVIDESAYRASLAAAWSCSLFARNRLSADPERFSGANASPSGTLVSLTSGTDCTILSASTTGTLASTHTQGHAGQRYTFLYVRTVRASSTAPFHIQSWELR